MNSFKVALSNDTDGLLKSRRGVFFATLGENTIVQLTTGVFYTTLLLILLEGSSFETQNFYIALITGVQAAAGIGQLLSPLLFDRLRRKRPAVLTLQGINYLIQTVLLPLTVMLASPLELKAWLFTALVGISAFCEAVSVPAKNAWHMHSLTESIRIDYFTTLNTYKTLLSTTLGFSVSVLMDFFKGNGKLLAGVLLMRGVALLIATFVFYMYNRVQEPPADTFLPKKKINLKATYLVPFKYKPFLIAVFIQCLYSFATGFAANFYNAYLLDDVGISYTYFSLGTLFGVPCTVFGLWFWNKQIRRFSWMPILAVSSLLYSLCYCCNALVTVKTPYLYIIGAVYCQLICGGYSISLANLPYEHMPKENRTACFAIFNTAMSLSAAFSAFVAGKFLSLTDGTTLNIFGLVLKNRAYMCYISASVFIICAAVVFLLYKKKKSSH